MSGWSAGRAAASSTTSYASGIATLFTALRSQYLYLGRMLLVVDIVLQELLLGTRSVNEFSLGTLIERFGYPDPETAVRGLFLGETDGREALRASDEPLARAVASGTGLAGACWGDPGVQSEHYASG